MGKLALLNILLDCSFTILVLTTFKINIDKGPNEKLNVKFIKTVLLMNILEKLILFSFFSFLNIKQLSAPGKVIPLSELLSV
jgi:hypothetical protein